MRADLFPSKWSSRKILISFTLFSPQNQKGGAHLGRDKTIEKIVASFHWKDVVNEIREFVKTCDVCQRNNESDVNYVHQSCSIQFL